MTPVPKKINFSKQPEPPEIPGYYNTEEVAEIFGWTSRQMVFTLAKKEGWASSDQRAAHKGMSLYKAEDVIRYWEARRRTELLYKMGTGARGLVREPREGEADIECPVCGAYAYSTAAGIICVNNHRRRVK